MNGNHSVLAEPEHGEHDNGEDIGAAGDHGARSIPGISELIRFGVRNRLKGMLLTGDLTSLVLAYTLAMWHFSFASYNGLDEVAAILLTVIGAGAWAVRTQGLLLARTASVRTIELTRVARAVGLVALAVVLLDRVLHIGLQLRVVIVASILSALFVAVWRSVYRAWISSARSNGRYGRRTLIFGTDEEARRLIDLALTHPEMGIQIVGVVGDRDEAIANRMGQLWLGDVTEAHDLIEESRATGALFTATSATTAERSKLIRDLSHTSVHIQLALGVSGIDSRRITALPFAHEPMLHVEGVSLARSQIVAKRAFDIVASLAMLIIALPVFIAVAIAIKLEDRGPVFFRQERVGHRGQHFGVLKFRSMVVQAEAKLAELQRENERRGPLFKLTNDPRVTRVGRFIRESSIDELPQLLNVLRGQMSLVGPRPALPAEVAQFPEELRQRESVLPGITGLWQVEARDNASFEAYRRLDLFYVENWSLMLDLMIMFGTAEHLSARLFSSVWSKVRPEREELAGATVGAHSFESTR